jgi:hypothetical protein
LKITVESYERLFDASKGMRIVTDLLHPVLSKQTIDIMDTAMMVIMEEDMNKQVVVTMEGMSRVDPEAVTEKHIGRAATTEETRGLTTQTTGRIKDSGHDIRTKENGCAWR